MPSLQLIRTILTLLSILVGVSYFYQTVYMVLPMLRRRRTEERTGGAGYNYAVLIAARNEEAVLPYLLDSIRAQDYTAGHIVPYVIADNCTDRTAAVARAHGAVVYERFDRVHVGKGYALQALLENIRREGRLAEHDAFLVFDADNLIRPDYISQMDRVFGAGYETVCGYRDSKNFMTNWITAGYGLWYAHDCAHLNASRMRLGVSCACTGTGFGFTYNLLKQMGGWNFHTLVEDIEFDTWCAVRGIRMGYCPEAVLYDEQPLTFRQSWVQRTRWVQGGMQVSLKYTRALLRGLFHGTLRQRWACFENLTLTVSGYSVCTFIGALAALLALLSGGILGLAKCLILSVAGMYMGMLVVGVMTMLLMRERIPGTHWQKLCNCLTFPVFMMTYVPVTICSCFCKFQWNPTRHTVAVGMDTMPQPDRHRRIPAKIH